MKLHELNKKIENARKILVTFQSYEQCPICGDFNHSDCMVYSMDLVKLMCMSCYKEYAKREKLEEVANRKPEILSLIKELTYKLEGTYKGIDRKTYQTDIHEDKFTESLKNRLLQVHGIIDSINRLL